MAGDFNKPVVGSSYTNFPTEIRNNEKANARMNYEADADANVPDGAMQFNRTDGTFEQLETGVWVPKGIKSAGLDADAASRSTLLLTAFKDIANSNTASNITTLVDSNTAATSFISSITIPKAAKVTHLAISTSDTKSSGTLTIKLYKNAVDTSQSFNFSNGVFNQAAAITAVSFASGDSLQIKYTTSSMVWTTGVTNYICVQAWGHFTE